jgi:hypothetical protein
MKYVLAFIAALLPGLAEAQTFPTVPDHTVIGRIGAGNSSGPSEAIPWTTLLAQMIGAQSANTVYAGPATGASAQPAFRALVGADLPTPGASSLGGVQSKTCSTSNWFNTLSTGGVLGCSQPAFTDITGTLAAAQCPAATISVQGCVIPDNSTIIISGGKLVAQAGSATSVDAAGGTSVTNCGTANAALYNTSSNKVGCVVGQWTLLATLSASGGNFTDTSHLTSTYTSYWIVAKNILATTTGGQQVQLLAHSGGSYQSTGYITAELTLGSGSSAVINPTTFIALSQAGTIQTTGAGYSGMFFIDSPSQTSTPKNFYSITGGGYGGSVLNGLFGNGSWTGGNGAIDGFEITCTGTGGCASGSVEIYGRL